MSKEAMKLALEALETLHDENMDYLTRNKLGGENNQCMVFAREAITALREALAEQPAQQEPVALEAVYETIVHWDEGGGKRSRRELARRIVSLYTSPPAQRTWVGLTDEEIQTEWVLTPQNDKAEGIWFGRRIEAKLKERNQ